MKDFTPNLAWYMVGAIVIGAIAVQIGLIALVIWIAKVIWQ